MARRRDKDQERGLASARVRTLLARAAAEADGDHPELADRYGGLVRAIAERYQLGLAGATAVCRGCSTFHVPGRSVRVRVRAGRAVRTCVRCGRIRRTGGRAA